MRSPADHSTAHFGPGGPVATAGAWLELVAVRRDLDAAWPLTDPAFRRRLAQAWATASRQHALLAGADHALLVEELCAEEPAGDASWRAFADAQVREVAQRCRWVDLTGHGWASRPQPESPGYELVVLTDHGEDCVLEEPAVLPAFGLLMHHHPVRGWLVADLR
ncbi:MAG: hypothetical protein M3P39_00070 [Actinomycetota bacterium]|nr:hypothetical protein [Actinomycetota bacterium]